MKTTLNVKQAVIPKAEHFVALAVIRSLGKKKIHTTAISAHKNALAFYSKYCNNKLFSEDILEPYKNFSEEYLIMPTDEDVMIHLSKHRADYNCIPAFPDYSVLEQIFNKKLLLDCATELDVPCPKTFFFAHSGELEQYLTRLNFPMVIKPVHGSGGVGITFVESIDLLGNHFEESVKQFGPVIIQEKIPYSERYSVAVLMNYEQEIKKLCVLKALRFNPILTGPATVVESVQRPDLVQYSQRILESLQYYGVAELEFVIDSRDGSPKLMEINPRFWGSLQGAISAGVDFPSSLYSLIRDGDIEKNIEYSLGIRTRNVIYYDYRRLHQIVLNDYPLAFKISAIIEFIKFYKDDAYFIFDLCDLKPFLSMVLHSLHHKIHDPPSVI